ncbi:MULTISPECIES: conjugal transfer protein [Bacillus]|uniref:Transposase n=2 Tax=Bacillus cereus group TaxID=86661 RepID=A0A0J1HKI3_BACAN|nr:MULTISPECIES: conjugal transfer protein [Bacillus cereus group]KLV14229.1 transposase [Bacillus anthracis]MBL3742480.1 conjugal transfer protein [Bacillus cereus]MBL3865168.1 conjugal transfer protein [Bacillus cereus]MCU5386400.1 conjugal transfer protein [Bacillus cereus]MDA2630812.1 conjugal transfer protein [Bacillus cereus]
MVKKKSQKNPEKKKFTFFKKAKTKTTEILDMQQENSEALKEKKKRKTREKVPAITGRKVGKVTFWFVMGFVVVGSSLSFIQLAGPPRAVAVQEKKEEPVKIKMSEAELIAYANNFAANYFNWKVDMNVAEERRKRLEKFLVEGSDEQGGLNRDTLKNASSTLVKSEAVEVRQKGNEAEVTLKIIQKLEPVNNPAPGTTQAPDTPKEPKEVTRYFSIPILMEKGKMVVPNNPTIVHGEREKAPYKIATFKSEGREINTDAEIKKVEQFLQSVFKVYTEGTPEEIAYYFEKSNITNGLKGIMTFSKLENLRIYEDKDKGYRVLVDAKLKDNDSNLEYTYSYDLNLVNKDNKFSISSMKKFENTLEKVEGK